MAGVSTTHKVYDGMLEQWTRCRDVSLGSDFVKARGSKYLAPLDSHKEKTEKYTEYIMRALFYNATGRTVTGLSGAIFQKTPSVTASDAAKKQSADITLNGQPLEMFALTATKEYLVTGRYGILVDMATEDAVEPRPYWVGYQAEDIVNWRFEKMGGDQELSLVVLREYDAQIDPKDEFCSEIITNYRVLRLGTDGIYTQQLYIPVQDQIGSNAVKYVGQPVITPTRRGKALDFIPFSLPWVISTPPLLDLVEVNLSHYRGTADLKHGLHFTALPTPWVSGHQGDKTKPLYIGSGTAWDLDINGKAGMLEFTGHGLGAIRQDLIDMQRQMATLGARLLEEAPHYAETALSVSMRHSSDYATLRTIAQVVEQQLSFSIQVHDWWLGTETLVSNVKSNVELNKVFFDQSVSADELRALLLALQASKISYQTFYARLQNTGWTREGIDYEEELRAIEEDLKNTSLNPPPVPGQGNGTGLPPESVKPKKKIIAGPDGKTKYTIQEGG